MYILKRLPTLLKGVSTQVDSQRRVPDLLFQLPARQPQVKGYSLVIENMLEGMGLERNTEVGPIVRENRFCWVLLMSFVPFSL